MDYRNSVSLPRRFLSGFSSVLLLCGLYASLVRLQISWNSNPLDLSSVNRSLVLDPENASFWLRRAELLDQAGGNASESLRRAVELNPRDAAVWIRSSVDAESRGNYSAAEQFLLQAARVSRLYQPRWSLANFYFRRGAREQFWQWARAALDLEPQDATMLFDLCWRVSPDGAEVLRNAIPRRKSVTRQYVRFLLSGHRLSEAASAARVLEHDPGDEDVDVLLRVSDEAIKQGIAQEALASWNAVCRRYAQDCELLDPGRMQLNESTTRSLTRGHGFSWQSPSVQGITMSSVPGVAVVYFDGRQPESAEPLWRYLPVSPGRRYQLQFDARTQNIAPLSGLRWQVSGLNGGRFGELAHSVDLSSAEWEHGTLTFGVPSETSLLTLSLHYTRTPGSPRIEGSVATRNMKLVAVP